MKLSSFHPLWLVLTLSIFDAVPNSHAAVIVTTFGGNDTGTSSNIDDASGKAIGFTMPAGSTYSLNSIDLRLSSAVTVSSSAVSLALYSNDGTNTPGVLLATLLTPNLSSLSTTAATFTFNSGGGILLNPSTSYWATFTNTSTPDLSWRSSNPSTFTSSISATYLGAMFGPPSSPGTWTGTSSVRNALTIDAVAVPEPGAAALLGWAGFLFLRNRKRATFPCNY
jgi:hypothetical protein